MFFRCDMHETEYVSKALIKDLAALSVKKFRRRSGLFIAEGAVLVQEALGTGWDVEKIIVHAERLKDKDVIKTIALADPSATRLLLAKEKEMRRLSDTTSTAAIVGVVRAREVSLEDIAAAGEGDLRLAVLGGIQDPGNVGSIIRSADAYALDGVLLLKGCADWRSPKVLRSTAGSCFHVPIVAEIDADDMLKWLGSSKISLLAAVSGGGRDVRSFKAPRRWALALGNETAGPPDAVIEGCDERVTIVTPGSAESLNVAVSAGVLLHSLRA